MSADTDYLTRVKGLLKNAPLLILNKRWVRNVQLGNKLRYMQAKVINIWESYKAILVTYLKRGALCKLASACKMKNVFPICQIFRKYGEKMQSIGLGNSQILVLPSDNHLHYDLFVYMLSLVMFCLQVCNH